VARSIVARPASSTVPQVRRLSDRQDAVVRSADLLDGHADLASAWSALDALTAATGSPVTARPTWWRTWFDCYPEWTPFVPVVREGDRLVAAAVLAVRRRGGLTRVISAGHGRTDDVRLPAVDADAARRLATAVRQALDEARPWVLDVEQAPAGDPVVEALCRLLPGAEVRPGDGMPTVRTTSGALEDHLSRNSRKALAKLRNRLATEGLVPDVRWTGDPQEVAVVLPELAAVHRARDEALGRRSDHSDPRAARFFREVALRHAERGEVELLTLRLRGELASYVLALRDGRALRSWDNRLSPEWARYSAGRLANTEALRRVVQDPDLDELDWMRGEEPYKLQTATEVVPTCGLRAASSPVLRLGGGMVEAARELKRRSPALTRAWVAGTRPADRRRMHA
jgi:CelD/BcsL family acetyltransferase involved in cellulose biosynthesis